MLLVERQVGSLERDKSKATEFIERVGHLPMAVEIGAGQARDRGWDWLLDSTRERIVPALQRGRRPGRHDSVQVALALSYGRLDKAERMMFDLLSTLPPGEPFGAQDVEAMCPSSVLQEIARCRMDIPVLLHRFYERSLLQCEKKTAYRLHTVEYYLMLHRLGRRVQDR